MTLRRFGEIWLVDFEFQQRDGERPEPICMVALEARSRVAIRLGQDELSRRAKAPFSTGPDVLVVAYFATAEMNCFRALGWPLPMNLLDLYVEFSNQTNGKPLPSGRSLLGALVYHGFSGLNYAEKQAMRDLAIRGGPFTSEDSRELLDYCESDVRAIQVLLPAMEPFEVPYALLRGRYVKAVSATESNGIPIDVPALERLRQHWETIKQKLVTQLGDEYLVRDAVGGVKYPVYDGSIFRIDRFVEFLAQKDIPWPTLKSGAPDLADDTFRQMARIYPRISELRELRHALSQLRLNDIAVGKDGRNRCLISPFRSRTGRNQPSTSKFIFGSSVWLRGLIRPDPGWAVAYLDWSGQEYGIAAALSEDPAMMADYQSGDPYLTFAKRLGVVPGDATKKTHPNVREAFKVALGLGAMYGAGPNTIGTMIGQSPAFAEYLLRQHRQKYARFWAWRNAAVDYADAQPAVDRVRVDDPCRAWHQPPIVVELPDAGQRSRDDAVGFHSADGGWCPAMCSGPRRLPHRGTCGADRRRNRRDAAADGTGQPDSPRWFRTPHRRREGRLS